MDQSVRPEALVIFTKALLENMMTEFTDASQPTRLVPKLPAGASVSTSYVSFHYISANAFSIIYLCIISMYM